MSRGELGEGYGLMDVRVGVSVEWRPGVPVGVPTHTSPGRSGSEWDAREQTPITKLRFKPRADFHKNVLPLMYMLQAGSTCIIVQTVLHMFPSQFAYSTKVYVVNKHNTI